jgi:hypothetical protein
MPATPSQSAILDELTQTLKAPPTRPWQSVRPPNTGLSYVSASLNDVSLVESAGPRFAMMNAKFQGTTRIAIVHGERRLRLETVGPGLFGKESVHVRDETQEGFLYLCPSLKAFLHMPRASRPVFSTPLPVFTIETAGTSSIGGRSCQEIIVTAHSSTPIRWRVWLSSDPGLRAFAASMGHLHLGQAAFSGVVKAFGAPLKAAISVGDAAADPMSTFELQDLELRTVTDVEFNVPEGYFDLRDRSSKNASK